QVLCSLDAEGFGLAAMTTYFCTQYATAIVGAYQPAQMQLVAVQLCKTGNWHLTAAVQAFVQCALSDNTVRGILVMQGFEQIQNTLVPFAAFNTNSALTTGRQRKLCRQILGNTILELQTD